MTEVRILPDKDPSDEAKAKYIKSEKGKSSQKKYRHSEQGREAQSRYLNSEQGKTASLRYYLSPKAKKTRELQAQRKKLLSSCQKFLEENPGKTPEDFLTSLSNDHKEPNP